MTQGYSPQLEYFPLGVGEKVIHSPDRQNFRILEANIRSFGKSGLLRQRYPRHPGDTRLFQWGFSGLADAIGAGPGCFLGLTRHLRHCFTAKYYAARPSRQPYPPRQPDCPRRGPVHCGLMAVASGHGP